MLDVTPLGARAAIILLSLGAHAAVALAVVGQGPPAMTSMVNHSERAVAELTAPDIELAPPSTETDRAGAESAPPSHTHPYPVPRNHDAVPHDQSLSHLPIAADDRNAPLAAAPTVVEARVETAPRFVMTVDRATMAPGGATATDGQDGAPGSAVAEGPIAEASADTPARLLSGTPPAYTREAEAAGVEADVPLEIVIDRRGTVVSARVLARVGYGLDEIALQSIRGFRFTPARRDGRTAAVRMRWLMRFQLK